MFQFCTTCFPFLILPLLLPLPFPFHPEKYQTPSGLKGVVLWRHWGRAGVKGCGSCGHKTSLALALPEREVLRP